MRTETGGYLGQVHPRKSEEPVQNLRSVSMLNVLRELLYRNEEREEYRR